MAQPTDVRAAGAVVTRKGGDVLLVHRPRYDDWSFPKGKLDRGEPALAAALREVGEETGLQIRLGPRLTAQRYPVGARTKVVDYWIGRVVGDDDVSTYLVNHEIDDVRWVPWQQAEKLLTYDFDRSTLAEAARVRKRSIPLLVVRHALARSRRVWQTDDRLRPLLKPGMVQAAKLATTLAAYDVSLIASSTSARCVATVMPYAAASGWPLSTHEELSEEGATAHSVLALIDDLMAGDDPAVVCSHRPVLPAIFDAIGVEDPGLAPGAMLVVHHRRGRVVSTELHPPT